MRVSTRFPIAVHSLLAIAYVDDKKKMTSTVIAESTGSNAVIIRNIFADLKRSGLIYSSSGKSGGVTLAKEAKDISLWEIYCAVETDNVDEIFKFHESPKTCPIGKNIYGLMLPHMNAALASMKNELQQVSLNNLMDELLPLIKE